MSTQTASLKIKENKHGEVLSIELSFPVLEREDNGKFFVKCPLFNSIGFSNKSLDEARKEHDDDLGVFFDLHIKRHSLKTALRSLGWVKTVHNKYQPPVVPSYLLEGANTVKSKFKPAA